MDQKHPILTKLRIPGETFRLPSMGILYKNGELSDDVKDGEITINPMTAFNEIVMKSPDKLFSGKAVSEVLRDCAPQILKPEELFTKDIDFLMLCLKKVSYGTDISLSHTHTCEKAKEHEYSISLDSFFGKTKYIDPTTISDISEVTLKNGQKVVLYPPRYKNIIEIMQSANDDTNSSEKNQEKFLKNILSLIYKIDECDDRQILEEWVKSAPVFHINAIADNIEKISDWGIDYKSTVKCADCGADVDVIVPINPVSFFM